MVRGNPRGAHGGPAPRARSVGPRRHRRDDGQGAACAARQRRPTVGRPNRGVRSPVGHSRHHAATGRISRQSRGPTRDRGQGFGARVGQRTDLSRAIGPDRRARPSAAQGRARPRRRQRAGSALALDLGTHRLRPDLPTRRARAERTAHRARDDSRGGLGVGAGQSHLRAPSRAAPRPDGPHLPLAAPRGKVSRHVLHVGARGHVVAQTDAGRALAPRLRRSLGVGAVQGRRPRLRHGHAADGRGPGVLRRVRSDARRVGTTARPAGPVRAASGADGRHGARLRRAADGRPPDRVHPGPARARCRVRAHEPVRHAAGHGQRGAAAGQPGFHR